MSMNQLRRTFLVLLMQMLFSTLSADTKRKNLPKVLMIGDVVYSEFYQSVQKLLSGKVSVAITKRRDWHSRAALENLDKILLDTKWDLIHFNFGFNDLMYKDPKTRQVRVLHKDAGGVRVSSPQQYEKNLTELVKKLKATRAKLIWASTTPIRADDGSIEGILDPGSEVEYNKIAARVMKRYGVPINDMYAYGLKSHAAIPRHQKTFSYKGGLPMHYPVVKAVCKLLRLSVPTMPEKK